MTRDYLSVDDLANDELTHILDLADRMKADRSVHATTLAGKAVALIFEKSSTRTRVSFEVGVGQLGGYPLTLSSADLQLGRGETIGPSNRSGWRCSRRPPAYRW
jgi:ornithine carbamoyltransferase